MKDLRSFMLSIYLRLLTNLLEHERLRQRWELPAEKKEFHKLCEKEERLNKQINYFFK
jgi:hypothetical protein